MAATSGSRRVVIVGGGFAGLFAARALRRAPVQVTLIDQAEHHLFQPLLYQCATGILSEGKIATPLRDLLPRSRARCPDRSTRRQPPTPRPGQPSNLTGCAARIRREGN